MRRIGYDGDAAQIRNNIAQELEALAYNSVALNDRPVMSPRGRARLSAKPAEPDRR